MIRNVRELCRKLWAPLLLVAYYIIAVCFVSAQGDFPINDDIVYGPAVRQFMDSGHFVSIANVSSCFLHIAFGALICKAVGFSYSALHAITLVAGLVGVLLLYLTCLEIGMDRAGSALLAFVYAANPIYTNLCYTYMTDVPALMLCNAFFYSVVSAIRRERRVYWLLAALSLIAAIYVRQNCAVFSIATLALLLLPVYRKNRRVELVLLFAAAVVSAAIAEWLLNKPANIFWIACHREIQEHILGFAEHPLEEFAALLKNFAELWLYLGLFCAPICFGILLQLFKPMGKSKRSLVLAVTAVALIAPGLVQYIVQEHQILPFHYNIWDIPVLGGDRMIHVPAHALDIQARSLLTAGAIICGVTSLWLALQAVFSGSVSVTISKRSAMGLFCLVALLSGVLQVSLFILIRDYDRYYLFTLAPLMMVFAYAASYLRIRPAIGWSLAIASVLAATSSLAQQQFMDMTRARWQVLSWLESTGANPKEIDGGIEYNSLRDTVSLAPLAFKEVPACFRGSEPLQWIRWWPVSGETYVLSLVEVPGYQVIHRQQYWDGLAFDTGEVLVLKRITMAQSTPGVANPHD